MNIINIQIKAKSFKLQALQQNHYQKIFISGRLGTILSPLTPIQADQLKYNHQIHLCLSCQQSYLNNCARFCCVIYGQNQLPIKQIQKFKKQGQEQTSSTDRVIVGMIFLNLNEKQNIYQKYSIQQCNEVNASVELCFNLSTLQVKRNQTSSQASRSSYAQIQEFHNFLSTEHPPKNKQHCNKKRLTHRRNESTLQKSNQLKKSVSEQQNRNQASKRVKTEDVYGESVSSSEYQEHAPSENKDLQIQLNKCRDKNMILTNLLIIEETKFRESEQLIKKIMNQSSNQIQMGMYNQIMKKNQTEILQGSTKQLNKYQKQIQILIKQRDQLYSISQQLFERTKSFKMESERLTKSNEFLHNQIKHLNDILQYTKNQNQQLKKQFYQYTDRQNGSSNEDLVNQLRKQINQLNIKNRESDRKLKESLKAIGNFKNDALEARQQIILKDQQIQRLKYQKGLNRNMQDTVSQNYQYLQKQFGKISDFSISTKNQQLKLLQQHKKLISNKNQLTNSHFLAQKISILKHQVTKLFNLSAKNYHQQPYILQLRKQIMILINNLQSF